MDFKKFQDEKIPVIGLGTWQIKDSSLIKNAIDIGYRHIDTAQMYRNERYVGKAIDNSEIFREKIFLTTKLSRTNLREEDVFRSFEKSLTKLKTDYVDLLLIHWPNSSVPLRETIEAMNKLQDENKARYIGVSNFSVDLLRKAKSISKYPLLCNQVEYHPFYNQDEILEFCMQNNMLFISYSPLAKGRVLRNNELKEIGKKYDKTSAQITLRWHIQQENVIAIPKAGNIRHLKENIDIFDFKLDQEDMEKIFKLEKDMKLI